MIRLVGAVLMLTASALLGSLMASHGKRRIRDTEAALALLLYVKRSIEAYRTPVGMILSSYRCEYLESTGFSEAMRRSGLSAALEEGHLELSQEAQALLTAFSAQLGTDYAEREVKRCEDCLRELESLASLEREKLTLNGRLYRFLPPLAASCTIILLI